MTTVQAEYNQTLGILQNQIKRLARIYTSRPVSVANIDFHNRVGNMQVGAIKAKRLLVTKFKAKHNA